MFILSGSLIQSKITDACLYGNIKVSMKTLKEDAVEEEKEADTQRPKEMLKLQKCTRLMLRLNLLVIEYDSMFIFKEEKQLVLET